ncbi:MAG: queuosine precursor transporter [Phycisphaerales bacterium]|nr:queuosine precursor transporter [Phycisphaerales bacterium]
MHPRTDLTSNPYAFSRQQLVYVWLTGVSITSLVMANVLGVKIFSYETGWTLGGKPFNVEHTVGMLPFPVTFLLTDLLNEYYGKKAARRVAWISFFMAALAFVFIQIALTMPTLEGIPGTATDAAFRNIFASASLMYVASLMAFLGGSMLDIVLFGFFKRLTGDRYIWVRTTGSTVISQMVDSLLVTFLFFWVFPSMLHPLNPEKYAKAAEAGWVLKTAATGYILKFFIALAMTPVIYFGRWVMSRWLGLKPIRMSR